MSAQSACLSCAQNAQDTNRRPENWIASDDHWRVCPRGRCRGRRLARPGATPARRHHRGPHRRGGRRAGDVAGPVVPRAARGDRMREDLRRAVRRAAGFEHVHFHIVPRADGLPHQLPGPSGLCSPRQAGPARCRARRGDPGFRRPPCPPAQVRPCPPRRNRATAPLRVGASRTHRRTGTPCGGMGPGPARCYGSVSSTVACLPITRYGQSAYSASSSTASWLRDVCAGDHLVRRVEAAAGGRRPGTSRRCTPRSCASPTSSRCCCRR